MAEDLAIELSSHAPRRRAINFLLEPTLQLKLPLYLLLITAVFLSLQALNGWMAFSGIYAPILRESGASEALYEVIRAQTHDFLIASASIGAGYVLVVIGVSVAYAHRMVGPTLPIRRHVNAMRRGDFSSRARLRQGDAFATLADDLNALAEELEKAPR